MKTFFEKETIAPFPVREVAAATRSFVERCFFRSKGSGSIMRFAPCREEVVIALLSS